MTMWDVWCSLGAGDVRVTPFLRSGCALVAFGVCRSIHNSTVNLCKTITSSPVAMEFCVEYMHAVLDQRGLLKGVKYLDQANADEVWDLSIKTSCRVPFSYRGRPGLLALEETSLASDAIIHFCGGATTSCWAFADCFNGVFETLLVHKQVANLSTRLTGRELLELDGAPLGRKLVAARAHNTVWSVPTGPFIISVFPGLSLSTFATQVCQGVPPRRVVLLFSLWARVLVCRFGRIWLVDRRCRLHRRSDGGLHPRYHQHGRCCGEPRQQAMPSIAVCRSSKDGMIVADKSSRP
jgi:hypothetical protein